MTRRSLLLIALLSMALAGVLASPPLVDAAVGLFNFRANSVADGIRLSWETGFEDNNLGFNLFRAQTNDRERATQVNPSLIPSLSQGGGGASYEYLDRSVAPNILYYYWIETVGDTLQEPVPPASAFWSSGAGLATQTPRPTTQPSPTQTAPPTTTATPTTAPVPPTATALTPLITATLPATASPGATTLPEEGTTEPPPGALPDGSGNEAPAATATRLEESSPQAAGETPPGSTPSQVPLTMAETAPTEVAALAGLSVASLNEDEPSARAIGSDRAGPAGTVLTGSLTQGENTGPSTAILMLLIAGAVLLLGGGVTAIIMWRHDLDKARRKDVAP